jgi:WhiB family redox-sensing transcriptional regulator
VRAAMFVNHVCSGQDSGVWGGLSEDERRAMKRRAARHRARMLESQNQNQ